jgi:protocatechuate 3,4-dioxygenase beta subunit
MRSPWVIVLLVLAALAAAWVVSGVNLLELLEGGSRRGVGDEREGGLGGDGEAGDPAAGAGGGAGGPRLAGVEVVRRGSEGGVRGRVLDVSTGKPVHEAGVLLTGRGQGGVEVAMNAKAGEDGTFALLEVPLGDAYAVRVEAKMGARNVVGVAVASGGVTDLGDLWLGHAGTIEGVVLDAAGQPVRGAEVQLHRGAASLREFLAGGGFLDLFRNLERVPEPQQKQESGAQGTFRFEGVSPGSHSVLARAPGHRQAIVAVTLTGDGGVQKTTVRLAPSAGISGQVVDAAGSGMAGVTVVAMPEGSSMPTPLARTFAVTGPDGAFRFETLMGDGDHMLIAAAAGYPSTFAEAGAGDVGVRITMKRGATLELTLLVDEGGAPIEGADLLVAVGGGKDMERGPETLVVGRTDATGTAVLEVRPGVLQMLLASHPERPTGFWAARMGGVTPGALKAPDDTTLREGRTRLTFRQPQGITLVGRVLDERGAPLTGAEVSTVSWMGGAAKAVSDGDGAYRLPSDGMMWAAVHAKLPGWVQTKTESPDGAAGEPKLGGEKRLDIRMRRAGAVSGRVLAPDGQPLPGARVTARVVREGDQPMMDPSALFAGAPSSITLGDGSYVIDGVPAGGKVRVVARREGLVDTGTEPFKLSEGGAASAPDIRMFAGAEVAVRVTGHDGAPVSGALVHADVERAHELGDGDMEDLMGEFSGRYDVRTGAAGDAVISLLPPGKVTLRVSAAGHAPGGAKLEIGAKGGPDEPVRVRLAQGVTLSGRALDAQGAPLAGVRVQVMNAGPGGPDDEWSNEWDRARSATSDADGVWRVSDLPQRPLRIQARKEGHRAAQQDVGAQREGIELTLAPQSGDATARIAEIDRRLMEIYPKLRDAGADSQGLMNELQALQRERNELAGE